MSKDKGIYGKYLVERLGDVAGKHDNCDFFVLDATHDEHALPALEAYIASCSQEYPKLAQDLRDWIKRNAENEDEDDY